MLRMFRRGRDSGSNVYRRLDSDNPPMPDSLEDGVITRDLYENRYNPDQFKKIPWKGIILAILLFSIGSVLLIIGILILTDYITAADHDQGFVSVSIIHSSSSNYRNCSCCFRKHLLHSWILLCLYCYSNL